LYVDVPARNTDREQGGHTDQRCIGPRASRTPGVMDRGDQEYDRENEYRDALENAQRQGSRFRNSWV
jgi:hypothetical protein